MAIVAEKDRTCFNHSKTEQELGLSFRALELTLTDTVTWYRDHGWFEKHSARASKKKSSSVMVDN